MKKGLKRVSFIGFLGTLFFQAPLLSVTNAEISAGIQIDFTTPGARSLALGGAFVGLADDATAAYTNPAGLSILSKLEVSFEIRSSEFTTEYIADGSIGQLTDDGIVDINELQRTDSTRSVDNLSFLSVVYPIGRLSLALYRHELANFKANLLTQGPFVLENDGITRLFPAQSDLNLEIENLGFAIAWKVSDRFSIGLGGSRYRFDLKSDTLRYDFVDLTSEIGGLFGLPNYSSENIVNRQTLRGDDDDLAFNAGFLWRLTDRWSVGGVYRQGPGFEFTATNEAGPSQSAEQLIFKSDTGRFSVPDVFGLGVSFKPKEALTLAFDYSAVEYSSLTDDTIDIFVTREDTEPSSVDSLEATRRLQIEDSEEFHFGLEYVFINLKTLLALRAGAYYDPDHRISFEGSPEPNTQSRITNALFFPGEDEMHYSLGFGLVLRQRVQFDVGADFSEAVDRFSFSAIIRF